MPGRKADTIRGAMSESGKKKTMSAGFMAIILFKLFKGILLLIVGIGAVKLLHHDAAETLNHWVSILRVDPDNHYIHAVLS